MDDFPRLKHVASDIRALGDGSVRLEQDAFKLQSDTIQDRPDAPRLNTADIKALCTDLGTNANNAQDVQTEIAGLLNSPQILERERRLLVNAQTQVEAIADANAQMKASVPGQCGSTSPSTGR
jgi:hypothetical protein